MFKKHLGNYYFTKASIYISLEVCAFMKWNCSEIFFQSLMFSCFTSVFYKKYCCWFVFHILHPHPLCKKQMSKTMLQVSVKLEYRFTNRPHLKISENEKHVALSFWFTEELFFFLCSPMIWEGGRSFIRKDFMQVTLENIYILNVCNNYAFRVNISHENCKMASKYRSKETKVESLHYFKDR